MRRILRLLLHALLVLAAVISLPLLIASLIFWARSHYHADSFWFNAHNHARALITNAGHVKLYFQRVDSSAPFTITADAGHRAQAPSDPGHAVRDSGLGTCVYFAGFAYAAGRTPYGHSRAVLIPFWFFTLCFAAAPVISLCVLRRVRIRCRRLRNLCVTCAYDLRATKDRCPECGTPVASSG